MLGMHRLAKCVEIGAFQLKSLLRDLSWMQFWRSDGPAYCYGNAKIFEALAETIDTIPPTPKI